MNVVNCSFCNSPTTRQALCKTCRDKKATLKFKYGMSLEGYRTMITDQRCRCAICNVLLEGDRDPHIDHCHEYGHVRGILCSRCNTGLGMFKDSVRVMICALWYVIRNMHSRKWWVQKTM